MLGSEILLGIAGFVIGIFAVIFGGSMFFSLAVFNALFPNASFGAVVGSIKAGSFFRGLLSTIATAKQIDARTAPLYAFVLVGGVFGALSNASLSQSFILPAVIFGILVNAYPNRIRAFIGSAAQAQDAKQIFAFAIGVYGGFFGAGISLLLVALIRVFQPQQYGDDSQIAATKIQARFLEFLLGVCAISGHLFSGSLSIENSNMWLPWAIGSALGGMVGAILLTKMRGVPGKWQARVLYGAFAVALISAILTQFR